MGRLSKALWNSVFCFLLLIGGAGNVAAAPYVVFSHNDSGMHCIDSDFSIWAILGLGNSIHAQIVKTGAGPQILTSADAKVTYRAMADPSGSINTTSIGKTNFWRYVAALYGSLTPPVMIPKPNVGFLGQKMPGANNTPQPFLTFDAAHMDFRAQGIPITPLDDSRHPNYYPLMRVQARDTANNLLAGISAVVNVSAEMHCNRCHSTGNVAATDRGVTWSTNPNLNLQTRENVLLLHDEVEGTNLFASTPVLCADCHYSAATDTLTHGGITQTLRNPLTNPKYLATAMHFKHGTPASNPPVPGNGVATCYNCHPGQTTKCYRDPMFNAGIVCQACHGNLIALSSVYPLKTTGQPRQPWIDLPKCQSCHTGDAISHLGSSIILRQAYAPGDPAATPRIAQNKRFAEQGNKLYKESLGHHGINCDSCHGSPHAIWPTNQTNDNLEAIKLQGHAGQIAECSVCHLDTLPATIDGPHGLHNVNSSVWINSHPGFWGSNPNNCKACHGKLLEGTVISKAQANRSFRVEGATVTIPKGRPISCSLCHENPLTGG